ncbi:hypothetical protein EWM64_g4674 [Hericium alpestre]|uniref:Retrotransposon gag domain-containing protein n=1 Tax=Hericium alpestre TaxID=135208 RepID=A0A4Z0A0W3_9AGAM|nr:hypothetical protein EWM64_g4674 [Hericium alpestre]
MSELERLYRKYSWPDVLFWIISKIQDKVGAPPPAVLPNYTKSVKLPAPKKYSGQDEDKEFDRWLTSILRWIKWHHIMGDINDKHQMDAIGHYLSGDATEWFTAEVEDPQRSKVDWTFKETIIALYT